MSIRSAINFGMRAIPALSLVATISCESPRGVGQVVADFNNDNRDDVVGVSYDRDARPATEPHVGSYDAYISFGQADGGLSPQTKAFHFPLEPANLQVGDVNGDGNKDLLFIAYDVAARPATRPRVGSFDQYVALGNGDGTFQEPKKISHYDIVPEY